MPEHRYPSADLQSRIADLARADAGHVILAVALVDQMLETLILAYLPTLSTEQAKMLFAHRGPLGSLPAKNQFAYAPASAG